MEEAQDLGMGGIQKFPVGPLKDPLAFVEEDQPVRHQFRHNFRGMTPSVAKV